MYTVQHILWDLTAEFALNVFRNLWITKSYPNKNMFVFQYLIDIVWFGTYFPHREVNTSHIYLPLNIRYPVYIIIILHRITYHK